VENKRKMEKKEQAEGEQETEKKNYLEKEGRITGGTK
jgi:hypothetical protein